MNSYEQQLSPYEKLARGIPLSSADFSFLIDIQLQYIKYTADQEAMVKMIYEQGLRAEEQAILLKLDQSQKEKLRSQIEEVQKQQSQNASKVLLPITLATTLAIITLIQQQIFVAVHNAFINKLKNNPGLKNVNGIHVNIPPTFSSVTIPTPRPGNINKTALKNMYDADPVKRLQNMETMTAAYTNNQFHSNFLPYFTDTVDYNPTLKNDRDALSKTYEYMFSDYRDAIRETNNAYHSNYKAYWNLIDAALKELGYSSINGEPSEEVINSNEKNFYSQKISYTNIDEYGHNPEGKVKYNPYSTKLTFPGFDQ
ncbi:MAG TPA: hypothetical protein VHM20_02310 [Gammaproteobacteria bacterium]|jgi:hypothetical protein|nr:hypothetical protein [Gammaproteobacteria bacterium]